MIFHVLIALATTANIIHRSLIGCHPTKEYLPERSETKVDQFFNCESIRRRKRDWQESQMGLSPSLYSLYLSLSLSLSLSPLSILSLCLPLSLFSLSLSPSLYSLYLSIYLSLPLSILSLSLSPLSLSLSLFSLSLSLRVCTRAEAIFLRQNLDTCSSLVIFCKLTTSIQRSVRQNRLTGNMNSRHKLLIRRSIW